MGRRKVPLELIANEKSRNSTFIRRKEGLKKKLHEFTTLCDIDACMIIYGPYLDGHSMKLDTWPSSPTEVSRIINKYYKSKNGGVKKKEERAHTNLAHFLENRKRKINDDIEKLRRGNNNNNTKAATTYTGWDHRMCHASYDQLKEILHLIDSRVDLAEKFMTAVVDKEKNQLMKGGGGTTTQKMMGCTTHVEEPSPQSYTDESNAPAGGSHHMNNNMQLVAVNDHLQEPKPLDSYMPQNYMLDQGGLQTYCPPSRTKSFTMMMLMDEDEDDDYHHDGSSSSSTNNLQYTSLLAAKPSIYHYDPRSSYGSLENVAYNNCLGLSSVGNSISPPIIQQPAVQQQFDHPRSSGLLENVRYNNNYRSRMSSVDAHYYSPPNIQQPAVQQQIDHPRSYGSLENVAYNNNYRSRMSSVDGYYYSPPNIQQLSVQQQFDPRPYGSLENIVAYNNYLRASSEGHYYYSSPNIQQPVAQQQFVQRPMIVSNAAHHVMMMPSDHSPPVNNDYQLNENYYDFTNFQMRNKRGRY